MISVTLILIGAFIFIAYNSILFYTLTNLKEKVTVMEIKLEDSVQALKEHQEEKLSSYKTSQEYQEALLSSRIELLQQRQVQAVSDLNSKLKGFKENFMNNY